MATLTSEADGKRVVLRVQHLIGRWAGHDLVLDDPRVSSLHAVVSYKRGKWILTDLGSSNGTAVDGEKLEAAVPLRVGQVITFGGSGWRVQDVSTPRMFAVEVETGETVQANDGVLALPDENEPVATLVKADEGWVVEREEGTAMAFDREVVRAGERTFRVHLPLEVFAGSDTMGALRNLANLQMRFSVSLDQESVGLSLAAGTWSLDLGDRNHHELLFVLAQGRKEDAELPPAERGWMYQDELARKLGWNDNQVYLAVHRARKQFAQVGVMHASGIVERRRRTGQVRIGVPARAVEITDRER